MSKVAYFGFLGSLMYAMVCLHPDLAYTIDTVSK